MIAWALAFQLRAHADSVCARNQTITLRASASQSAPITWRAPKFMPFVRLDQRNDWAKLRDQDGVTHFARAAEVTAKIRCVTVKARVANLHRDPAVGSPAGDLKTVDRYTAFERLADKGEWIQVRDQAAHVAWIRRDQVWLPIAVSAVSF